jgi:hypothetical protein
MARCGLIAGGAFCVLAMACAVHADVTVTPLPDATDTPPSAAPTPTSAPAATSQPAAGGAPTAELAQSLVDAGKYKEALRVLLHLLDLRGTAVTFDRQQMLILRAECQVQLHSNMAAQVSLQMAEKESTALGADDDAAQAEAFAFLIQKSTRDIFVAQTGPDRKAINILDRTARKTAYAELFADTYAADQQKLKAAVASNTLPPLADLAKDVVPLQALERVTTGASKESTAFSKKASHSAAMLVSTTLMDFSTKVSRISSAANQVVNENTSAGTFSTQYRRAGLTGDEIRTLRDIGASCEEMGPMLTDFGRAFGDAEMFRSEMTRAEMIKEQAQTVLTKDYSTLR